ncbi:MAG: glycosyltransferase involved in cell wall biosynthesis [Flavobacterium sp.]|jgi:glycosyltransferase involved in cell wall biosynthesis
MKIGFDAKRFFHNSTGLGNYSRDFIRILSTFFPDNHYILYNPKKSNRQFSNPNGIAVTEAIPDSLLFKKLSSLWRSTFINSQLKKDKIEIFHGLSGELPFGISNKIAKVVTIHDLIFERYPELYSFFDRKIHFSKFSYAAKKADVIIAISEQTKSDILKYIPNIASQKIKVIYQGCNEAFKLEYSEERKNEIQKKFNLPTQFLLNVGTIEQRKNALQIVKAIENIDTTLVLIGRKTEYYKEIKKCAKEKNIKDKIKHLKNITTEELAIIYQLATIFVYPSIFEGFGIPIIEALYSKTLVITNKDGVFKEAGGENSIYIDVQSTEELTEKIDFLLKNPETRIDLENKGWQFVQKFNDETIANQIHSIYDELAIEKKIKP